MYIGILWYCFYFDVVFVFCSANILLLFDFILLGYTHSWRIVNVTSNCWLQYFIRRITQNLTEHVVFYAVTMPLKEHFIYNAYTIAFVIIFFFCGFSLNETIADLHSLQRETTANSCRTIPISNDNNKEMEQKIIINKNNHWMNGRRKKTE